MNSSQQKMLILTHRKFIAKVIIQLPSKAQSMSFQLNADLKILKLPQTDSGSFIHKLFGTHLLMTTNGFSSLH